MTWNRLPLFTWAIYATAIVQVLATPVIGITMVLLFLEKLLHIGIFDPALGGDPVLFQHFFWFYSHPAVYIMILPAMGIISDLMGTFSRQHVSGYTFIALSSVAIAFLGFLVGGITCLSRVKAPSPPSFSRCSPSLLEFRPGSRSLTGLPPCIRDPCGCVPHDLCAHVPFSVHDWGLDGDHGWRASRRCTST